MSSRSPERGTPPIRLAKPQSAARCPMLGPCHMPIWSKWPANHLSPKGGGASAILFFFSEHAKFRRAIQGDLTGQHPLRLLKWGE